MTHPAGPDVGVGRTAIWYGLEVEGALARHRVPTAFIDSVPQDPGDLAELQRRLSTSRVRHVFLTENFTDWAWVQQHVLPRTKGHLTIAVNEDDVDDRLTWPILWRATLMVRANMRAPWMEKLRANDQVTVGVPYSLVTWAVRDGVRSTPPDYKMDRGR